MNIYSIRYQYSALTIRICDKPTTTPLEALQSLCIYIGHCLHVHAQPVT